MDETSTNAAPGNAAGIAAAVGGPRKGLPESFFPETMLAEVDKSWKQWLGPLVRELPPCKMIIEGLRFQVATLLTASK
jgi:hypothetical protein